MARSTFIRTKYLESSIPAIKVAIESFNSPSNPYRIPSSVILMVNAIELLSKSILLKLKQPIEDKDTDRTIPAEKAVGRLFQKGEINEVEHQTIQQLISLRNEATHSFLDSVDVNIVFYLNFCVYKIYKNLIKKHYKGKLADFKENFLSISTDENITYAESVIGLMKSKKKDVAGRKLLYLLERGVQYSGDKYISQDEFEKQFKAKKNKNLVNRAAIGKYLDNAEQLRIIFVQAPKHHSVDVTITKHNRSKNILPVKIIQREIYKNNTRQIADTLGMRQHDALQLIKKYRIKEKSEYHQEIPNGKNPPLHRYSDSLAAYLKHQETKIQI
ncbi:MAG: DUF3644 domain-containing protein [Candidatus Paceibacterota bacterium]